MEVACIQEKTTTFQEALLQIRGVQNVVSVKDRKICFILVFGLFVPSRRKLNNNTNLHYAAFGKIEAK